MGADDFHLVWVLAVLSLTLVCIQKQTFSQKTLNQTQQKLLHKNKFQHGKGIGQINMLNKQRKVLGEEALQITLYHRSSSIQKPLRKYSGSSELQERTRQSGKTLVGPSRNWFSLCHPCQLQGIFLTANQLQRAGWISAVQISHLRQDSCMSEGKEG